MKICFSGDSVFLEQPRVQYWDNNRLIDLMRSCDLCCGNLEMVMCADQTFASAFCGGQWLSADARRLDDLARFGFRYFNTANNHTMDYAYEGMRITNRELDKRGILHSGSGESLNEAASYVTIAVNGIKIAFLSATASCDDAARAGKGANTVPGRPGVNMLRHEEILYVTEEMLNIIDEIADKTYVNARFMKAVKMGTHSLSDDIHRLGRLEFKKGDKDYKYTSCNKFDLERIKNEIVKAKLG